MKKQIFYLLFISSILFFIGCSDDLFKEGESKGAIQNTEGRTITLSASMPGGSQSGVRIALERENNQTVLSWEEGDELQLLFNQGAINVKSIVTVSNISADKKSAQFSLSIPTEIVEGDLFNLYGVYGGVGLSDTDPTKFILPQSAGTAGSLQNIQDREDVVLYFSAKDLLSSTIAENLNVNLQHLGALFNINLMNLGNDAIADLAEIRLTSSSDGWAYNSSNGGNMYDLVNEQFVASTGTDNYLSFNAAGSSISSGGTLSIWAWYPPANVFPELKLDLIKTDNTSMAVSVNSKSARTAPLAAGKNYTFHAIWDGAELQFTNATFNGISTIVVGGQFFRTGLMRYYPNFITPALLPNYEDYLDVYALISLNDMKTYSMDYFTESAANTANIDMRLSVSATDSRTILSNSGTFSNQYDDSNGVFILDLEGTDRLIVNATKFKRITDTSFDFINSSEADVLVGGNPTLNYIQRPAEGQVGYTEYGNIFGFKTAPTSTVGERIGVMKEVSRIQVPNVPGYGSSPNLYNLVVYAIKLF